MEKCPCGSSLLYAECCAPFHQGKGAPTPLALMRSRYSAYVLDLPTYLIETTHPASPSFVPNTEEWEKELSLFSRKTSFQGLEILEEHTTGDLGIVVFFAKLLQGRADVSFTERSFFAKHGGRWKYRSGQTLQGKAPHLMTKGQLRVLPLAYYPDPILRKVASPVGKVTPELRSFIEAMIDTMDGSDGIGLAAPQVHASIRVFILRLPKEGPKGDLSFGGVRVYIDPEVRLVEGPLWSVSEGCLSMPTITGNVSRPKEVEITYTDLEGKRLTEKAFGWHARIIQHEYDHLNGVLFTDHLLPKGKEAVAPLLERLQKRLAL